MYSIILSLLSLVLFAGCSSDTTKAKRNTKKTYLLEVNNPYCGLKIRKTFSTQEQLCSYISYETSKNLCAYGDFMRAFTQNSCYKFVSYTPGGDYDYNPSDIGGELPNNPILLPGQNSDFDEDILIADRALEKYYTVNGCIARIKNVLPGDDIIDLCAFDNPSYENEKDAPYVSPSNVEKDSAPAARAEERAEVSTPDSRDDSTAPTAPASTLDFNQVTYNSSTFRYEELTEARLPVVRITGLIDQKSPIFGQRHSQPDDIKAVSIVGIQTQCLFKAQLTSSANTLILTLLSDSTGTTTQIQACRDLFERLAAIENFEVKFESELKMNSGLNIPETFKFINE